jgi:carbamoyl-phosphate synthase large subunit
MPRDDSIRTVLVPGNDPTFPRPARDFDHSGAQAVKTLLGEGFRVVLVNPNPATIMTDPGLGAGLPGELRTYIEPLTISVMKDLLERERPDALLPVAGGPAALRLALEMEETGLLRRFEVRVLGAGLSALRLAEDRPRFLRAMKDIGVPVPDMPGKWGSGWRTYSLEMMADARDQCVVVCSIENIDWTGEHPDDSVAVAPAMTLTDREYQAMRDLAVRAIRQAGTTPGSSSVRFALHPETRRIVLLEICARLSGSSVLASKATGLPMARITAKLGVGYTMDEILNDFTHRTPVCFEPALDYVVVRIPRPHAREFPGSPARPGPPDCPVAEVMAIGATFKEAFLKATRSVGAAVQRNGDDPSRSGETPDDETLRAALAESTAGRLELVREALGRGPGRGFDPESISRITHIEPWFLQQLAEIASLEAAFRGSRLDAISGERLLAAKRMGVSDRRLAVLFGVAEKEVREVRETLGLHPVFRRVDTCAGELATNLPYLYSTWESACEAEPADRSKVLVLGGGPVCLGPGTEIDYCACHALSSLSEAGVESVFLDCNPGTVSTDYDTADRLYFEPVTLEDVLAVTRREKPAGVIVQFGGQAPLDLAPALEETGVAVLGTPVDSITLMADRDLFGARLAELGIARPATATTSSPAEALEAAGAIGYPVIVRSSLVEGGRIMRVVFGDDALAACATEILRSSPGARLFLDEFLEDAVEVSVIAVSDGESVLVAGLQQRIEAPGIHAGDGPSVLPPYDVPDLQQQMVRAVTARLAVALHVRGLLHVRLALRGGSVFVLEASPRATRDLPWVSKATGVPLVRLATRVILGERLVKLVPIDWLEPGEGENRRARPPAIPGRYFVRMPVFSPTYFSGADTILGPEARSTGEVLGVGPTFGQAYAKAAVSAGLQLPLAGTVILSIHDRDKPGLPPLARELRGLGFALAATRGTAEFLASHGLESDLVYKVNEGHPDATDWIEAGAVRLVVTTPPGRATYHGERAMRRAAIAHGLPCITALSGARAVIDAIRTLQEGDRDVESLQDLHGPDAESTEPEAPRSAVGQTVAAIRRGLGGVAARGSRPG